MYSGMGESVSWIAPAKGEIKYGLLKGQYDEKFKSRSVTFTPFNEEKSYRVNKEVVSDRLFEVLCERAVPAKAEVFDVDCHLAIPSPQPLEKQTLEYTYRDGKVAMCMDMESYEMVEIPCPDIPDNITEGCTFEYYPEIKYFYLMEAATSDGDADGENTAESVVTYEGFDREKQAHVIRIADGDEKTAEYTYGNENIEFTEEGIVKGMRVDMRLSFNDETCSLKAHLSKHKD